MKSHLRKGSPSSSVHIATWPISEKSKIGSNSCIIRTNKSEDGKRKCILIINKVEGMLTFALVKKNKSEDRKGSE